jgi:hypothetical protein
MVLLVEFLGFKFLAIPVMVFVYGIQGLNF